MDSSLAIIGDFNSNYRPHIATNEAIHHCIDKYNLRITHQWIATDQIEDNFEYTIKNNSGFWIAPGSPYRDMAGALKIIKYARENNIPTLGTCGGFQHMVIEFARNVLHIEDAQHAEYDPYASKLVVNPLQCTLVGQELEVRIIDSNSKTFQYYNAELVCEKYYCNFGLNPDYQIAIDEAGFKVVGEEENGEARILELMGHDFFVATLFVPQDNSSLLHPHKLIKSFLSNVIRRSKLNT